MKLRLFAYLLIAVVTLLACQTTTQLAGSGATPTANNGITPTVASGLAEKYQYIFAAPNNPIHLALVLDQANSVEATIPVQGGEISATGADGTVYTLSIPDGALAGATTITLTPVTSISGLPTEGRQTYAVQLSPEGLYLYRDAILTITPAQPIPLAQQMFFDYKAGGQTVGLAIPVAASQDLHIRLMHFSGYGVTEGTPADVATVQEQLGGDVEAALESLVAEAIARERQNQENGNPPDPEFGQIIIDLMNQWEAEVVKPALEAAGSSCAAGKEAIRKALDLERMRQLLGQGGSFSGTDLAALITTAATQCVKEEYQRCVDEHHINGMIPLWLGLKREAQLLNGEEDPEPPEVKLAEELTVKCLTFELQFHSEGSFDTGDGGYNSVVDGKVTVRFDPSTFTIKGSGPLENLSFEFRMPKGGKGMKCTADSTPGGGTFEVKSLAYVEDTRSETDPEWYVRDFQMMYFPGVTSESYQVHCTLTDSQGNVTHQDYAAPPSGYWSGIFFTLHQEELNGTPPDTSGGMPPLDLGGIELGALPPMPAPEMPADGGFFADSWDITPGDALMASKEWIRSNGGIGLTETGTLKLFHRPGN